MWERQGQRAEEDGRITSRRKEREDTGRYIQEKGGHLKGHICRKEDSDT